MRSYILLLFMLALAACKKDETGDPDPQKPSLSINDVSNLIQ